MLLKIEDPRFEPLLIALCEFLYVYLGVPEDGLGSQKGQEYICFYLIGLIKHIYHSNV